MFIAMNRFKVRSGAEAEFEELWRSRDRHLDEVPGFKEFKLLRGPAGNGFTLYSSHTVWESRQAFEDWTRSEAFRLAHKDAGKNKPLHIDAPVFEGFDVALDR